MNQNHETLLALTRNGIGHSVADNLSGQVVWEDIQELANTHGLSAVVLDGIEKLQDNKRPPKELLLQWIGNTLQSYEQRYELYRKTIAEIAGWHNSHGYKMMVLKGYACSLNWPKPEHRPCGDIDIWQFGKQKEADEVLAREKGIKIDNSHHHHTVFTWRDFTVENHYDFLNVHHHKSNVEIEAILKELGQDDSHYVELYGEKVYVPSPNLHALFLLRHSMSNFASTGFTIRHLLDWAFFVEKNSKEIDWGWLEGVLEKTVVPDGRYTIEEPLLTLQLMDGTERTLTMTQKWPIRVARPSAKRFPAVKPLITGQRILDTMFPLAKGGTAAIPGGFGTGKTMTQHQVAKWSDADVIIYIGCGERGNEMTQKKSLWCGARRDGWSRPLPLGAPRPMIFK